jgi:hypothetical protein
LPADTFVEERLVRDVRERTDGPSSPSHGVAHIVRRRLVAGLALLVPLFPALGWADPVTVVDERRPFRFDLRSDPRPGGGRVGGYVYNDYDSSTSRVVLLVEGVGSSGDVAGRTVVQVPGEIPGRHRTYVSVDVPAASSYRVRVLSFDFTHCRD